MLIDWTHFTPWAALAGGVLLGLASALFVLLNGRILGISGIVGGLLRPRAGDMGWRLAFLLGMLVAPGLYWLVVGPTQPRIDANWGMVVIAGIVGSGGLGETIYGAIRTLDIATSINASIAIVILTMVLDRVTQNLAGAK